MTHHRFIYEHTNYIFRVRQRASMLPYLQIIASLLDELNTVYFSSLLIVREKMDDQVTWCIEVAYDLFSWTYCSLRRRRKTQRLCEWTALLQDDGSIPYLSGKGSSDKVGKVSLNELVLYAIYADQTLMYSIINLSCMEGNWQYLFYHHAPLLLLWCTGPFAIDKTSLFT